MTYQKNIKSFLYLTGFILAVLIPIALTLNTIQHPLATSMTSLNPSPLGYSVSLLIFILPSLVLILWLHLQAAVTFQKKAFYYTLLLLTPTGVILDILFAHQFFTFENSGAVLGWNLPGVGGPIPIEEFVFYLSGFTFILLLYIWGDELWMARYNRDDYAEASKQMPGIIRFHPSSVVIVVILLAFAIIYKKLFSDYPQGLPWYWIYLCLIGFLPAVILFRSVSGFINWRSFSFTLAVLVLVSIIWEVTLALPYQWWGFQQEQMIGIFIAAWQHLPIEEVALWISVGYTTVIVYEAVKLWLASNKSFRHAMLGQ